MRQYIRSLLSNRKCTNRGIPWVTQENQSTVGDCPTFWERVQWFLVLVAFWAATNACHLTHGIHRISGKRFLVINFSTVDSLRDHPQGLQSFAPRRERGSVPQEMTNKLQAQFHCRLCKKVVDYGFVDTGRISAELHGRTAETANFGAAIRQIPWSSIILCLEDTIHKSSDYLFRFSIGCFVVDQRSGYGWFIWGIEVIAISFWKEISNFRDAGHEDRFRSKQDHPEFAI